MRSLSNETAARLLVSGRVTSGATWIEQFEISQNNLQIEDADTSDWKFVFKRCDNGSLIMTLSSGAEITVAHQDRVAGGEPNDQRF